MSSESSELRAACLCGAVRLIGRRTDSPFAACHCSMCRRWSGHVWAGPEVEGLTVEGDALRWFRSSDTAERGFCGNCGSSLVWRQIGAGTAAISAGALEPPSGLRLEGHIYTAHKGDYYDIADGLPQKAES